MKPFRFSRDAVLVGFSMLLAVVPLALGGLYVYNKHQWAKDLMSQLEPRYARLMGLERQKTELDQARQRVLQVQTKYVYPASMDVSQAGNAAQQHVREIFAAAGLQISSSQVLPPKDEKGYDRIALKVQADGELLALQSVLTVLGSQTPVIIIDALQIQLIGGLTTGNPKAPLRLTTQFSLSVLKDRT
ncbi:MAG: type II secretion system protein GspM [Acidovorax sp.]|uniref:type II secretion system protein GspM n=1 Tax=Acidovorax sp. TaxID=1872122 RepID=UPI00391C2A49